MVSGSKGRVLATKLKPTATVVRRTAPKHRYVEPSLVLAPLAGPFPHTLDSGPDGVEDMDYEGAGMAEDDDVIHLSPGCSDIDPCLSESSDDGPQEGLPLEDVQDVMTLRQLRLTPSMCCPVCRALGPTYPGFSGRRSAHHLRHHLSPSPPPFWYLRWLLGFPLSRTTLCQKALLCLQLWPPLSLEFWRRILLQPVVLGFAGCSSVSAICQRYMPLTMLHMMVCFPLNQLSWN